MNILLFELRAESFRRKVKHAFQAGARQSSHRVPAEINPAKVVEDMQRIVRLAGEDGGNVVKGRITLAARRLNLSPREAERLYYGQRKQIDFTLAARLYQAEDAILAIRQARLEAELSNIRALRSLNGGAESQQNSKAG